MIDELRQDVSFALRQLRSSPAFTVVTAATLALGIGANSAIFALVDATLLRPLPYAGPERLVTIWETSAATPRGFGVAAEHERLARSRRLPATRRPWGAW